MSTRRASIFLSAMHSCGLVEAKTIALRTDTVNNNNNNKDHNNNPLQN